MDASPSQSPNTHSDSTGQHKVWVIFSFSWSAFEVGKAKNLIPAQKLRVVDWEDTSKVHAHIPMEGEKWQRSSEATSSESSKSFAETFEASITNTNDNEPFRGKAPYRPPRRPIFLNVLHVYAWIFKWFFLDAEKYWLFWMLHDLQNWCCVFG